MATNGKGSKNTKRAKKASEPKLTKAEQKSLDENREKLKAEILSICLFCVSILIFICVIGSDGMGIIGSFMSSLLKSLFGLGAIILPIILMIFSVQTLIDKNKKGYKFKLTLFIGFFVTIICIAHILGYNMGIGDISFPAYVAETFVNGGADNGGLIGGLIGGTLYSLIGKTGSLIFLATIALILVVLATGRTIGDLLGMIGDFVDGTREDFEEYRRNNYEDDYYEDDYEYEEDEYLEKVESRREQKRSKREFEDEVIPTFNLEEDSFKKSGSDVSIDVPKFMYEYCGNKNPYREKTFFEKLYENSHEENVDLINYYKSNGFVEERQEENDVKEDRYNDIQNSDIKIIKSEDEENVLSNIREINNNKTEEVKINEDFGFESFEDIPDFEEDFINNYDDVNINSENDIESLFKEEEESVEDFKTENQNVLEEKEDREVKSYGFEKKTSSDIEVIEADETKEVTELEENKKTPYKFPSPNILAKNPNKLGKTNSEELIRKSKLLEETLSTFGVDAKVVNVSQGPTVTRYELIPPKGMKVGKITSLDRDIELGLAAKSVRIEAPIPGTNKIGIELGNDSVSPVYFSEVLLTDKFRDYESKLAFGVGKDITGTVIVADVADMTHLLIAGATGAGKSVCINTLITSILYKATPDEVKLIMIDPKKVELSVYNGIPHLLIPVISDVQKAAGALNWAIREMERRYDLLEQQGVRNIKGYNKIEGVEKLPYIVIIIDELADLMMTTGKEVENAIVRLTQLARAAGMHLVIATQRPDANVVTGLIKANVPSRIAFKVAGSINSKIILDEVGAEKLLGRGDMLLKTRAFDDKPLRIQGAFVTDEEVEEIVNSIKTDGSHYDNNVIDEINRAVAEAHGEDSDGGVSGSGEDSLIDEVIKLVAIQQKASTSFIQRKFKIGYNRAARIIDELEERGIVGPDLGGTKGREVKIDKYQYNEWKNRKDDY